MCLCQSSSLRMRCSQYRLCHTGFSLFLVLEGFATLSVPDWWVRSASPILPTEHDRLKKCLINRHLVAKSSSSSGNRQIQCTWSGNTTIPSISNGRFCFTWRKAVLRREIFSGTVRIGCLLYVTTVKKYQPPGRHARRYSIFNIHVGWVKRSGPIKKVIIFHWWVRCRFTHPTQYPFL